MSTQMSACKQGAKGQSNGDELPNSVAQTQFDLNLNEDRGGAFTFLSVPRTSRR